MAMSTFETTTSTTSTTTTTTTMTTTTTTTTMTTTTTTTATAVSDFQKLKLSCWKETRILNNNFGKKWLIDHDKIILLTQYYLSLMAQAA